ncbi:P27 family phage terminase small subunit [Fusobacterium mortiferum]|jgi:phage terminase, small subunit|uniref:P27 family phage terminase small subunit n=1 Tax=Fusobacterium mortiferum TaxID=850 RepID=UPI001F1CCF0E|nr:P27 family phage terminase small subunit [Fusobacterium mortiferum]MCF2628132.1 P27 family phage terminase small subunit [Fusobacterium mortiferum]DAX78449.1 MAG TPA: terminase small subunit [Caudoviricetes sp.]
MGAKKPLELQTKHLTKAEIAKKELEESIVFDKDALNNKPEWLVDEIACKEWDRLVNEFSKNSLICNLDYNNLGAYCNAFSKWVKASKMVKLKIVIGKQANPYVSLELKYSEEMRKYAVLLGMSAEGKLKLKGAKVGKEEDKVLSEFGDI